MDRARIASAQHPPQAYGVFHKIGWGLAPHAANDRFTDVEPLADRAKVAANLAGPGVVLKAGVVLKEWVGLVVYYALDRTSEVIPGPDKTYHAE